MAQPVQGSGSQQFIGVGLVHRFTGWGVPLDGVEDTQQVEKECRAERRLLQQPGEDDTRLIGHAATRIKGRQGVVPTRVR